MRYSTRASVSRDRAAILSNLPKEDPRSTDSEQLRELIDSAAIQNGLYFGDAAGHALGIKVNLKFKKKLNFRHYKEAYKHCSECEMADSEIYELLSVASLLNYKVFFFVFFNAFLDL